MGCQTTYSVPITIPSGSSGATGAAGAAGADGAAVIINTIASAVTSTGTGSQNLASGTLTGGTIAAGDILEIEGYIEYTIPSFNGTVSLVIGSTSLVNFTVNAATRILAPPDPIDTVAVFLLKAKILFKTTSTSSSLGSVEVFESDSTAIRKGLISVSEDTASNLTIKVTCNPISGAVTNKYLTVTLYKKV